MKINIVKETNRKYKDICYSSSIPVLSIENEHNIYALKKSLEHNFDLNTDFKLIENQHYELVYITLYEDRGYEEELNHLFYIEIFKNSFQRKLFIKIFKEELENNKDKYMSFIFKNKRYKIPYENYEILNIKSKLLPYEN